MPHADPEKRRAYKRAWEAKNRERHRANQRAWQAKNREKMRAYEKKYRDSHAEEVRNRQKHYEQTHADGIRQRKKIYREAHKDTANEYQREWQQDNPEKVAAYTKKWRLTHAEQHNAAQKAYRAQHPEKVRQWNQRQAAKGAPQRSYHAHKAQNQERSKLYNREHKEEKKLYTEQYRAEHPEKVKAWKQADYARRPNVDNQRRRARKAGAPVNDLTAAQWTEIKEAYGYRCVYCHRKMKRLTQDHLTPLSKQGSNTVPNVVPACQSCNSRKYNNAVLSPVQPLLLTIAPAKKKAG